MDLPEDDPWNAPDLHKGHAHAQQNGTTRTHGVTNGQNGFDQQTPASPPSIGAPTLNQYTASLAAPESPSVPRQQPTSGSLSGQGVWGYFDANNTSPGAGFNNNSSPLPQNPPPIPNPFGADGNTSRASRSGPPQPTAPVRSLGGRTGSNVEETVLVTLMPGKEGIFMFQHHNYEVTSQRRGSKVIRRYSDFVWLLDCLHKRYPFRVLPLLPPKRVALNGNHLSNDGSFIEKRRRGLARFLNALVRHPVLSQEQLVVMFMTVPTVSLRCSQN